MNLYMFNLFKHAPTSTKHSICSIFDIWEDSWPFKYLDIYLSQDILQEQ